MQLSNHALQLMGYNPIPEGENIRGVFRSITVYRIDGLGIDAGVLEYREQVDGIGLHVGLGVSVNGICQNLLGTDFAEDEAAWTKERNSSPPYLAVAFGPTDEFPASGKRYAQDAGGRINTYDSFRDARAELTRQEGTVMPRLLSALACSFDLPNQPVKFLLVDRIVFGIATDGRFIHDVRMTGSANLSTSTKIEEAEMNARLRKALSLAATISPKVARFYHLAVSEDDPLKKFLYFFLAIEIDTHAAFGAIDHAQALAQLLAPPSRATASIKLLFDKQPGNWRAIKERFMWCVACVWRHMSDADVDEFTRIKAVRDGIAHGSISVPPDWAVASVEKLAAKLQADSNSTVLLSS